MLIFFNQKSIIVLKKPSFFHYRIWASLSLYDAGGSGGGGGIV